MSMSISDVELPVGSMLGDVYSTYYSSIELDSSEMAEGVHKAKMRGPYRVVAVGSLAQLYKGTDVLIDAVAACVHSGMELTAVIVGDGKYRSYLEAQAERVGMGNRIEFLGHLSAGAAVRNVMDSADLFVQPSRTEGLPRALIEAMARGLPCIGSDVGGIPELLRPSELVPAGDSVKLASKMREVLQDRPRSEAIAEENLSRAADFRASVLADRRRQFYQHIRDRTEIVEARKRV